MDDLAAIARHDAVLPPAWNRAAVKLNSRSEFKPPRHVHVVQDIGLGNETAHVVRSLAACWSRSGAEVDVVAVSGARSELNFDMPGVGIHHIGLLSTEGRVPYTAGLIAASRLPAYVHVTEDIDLEYLRELWACGARTVPVVHDDNRLKGLAPDAWNEEGVPFVVALDERIERRLRELGLRKPVRVMPRVFGTLAANENADRTAVRAAFGANASSFLIGMAAWEGASEALHAVAELRRRSMDACLAIVGEMDGAVRGMVSATATRLGIRHHVVLPGPAADLGAVVEAFDAIVECGNRFPRAVLSGEAVAAGVPVATLWSEGAEASANAILEAISSPTKSVRSEPSLAAAHLWPWSLVLGPAAAGKAVESRHALFVTGNLDVGGAQRSLCNLTAELARTGTRVTLAVLGSVGVPAFLDGPMAAGVEILDLSGRNGQTGRIGRILSLVAERRPEALVWWNADARTKMAVVAAMHGGPTKLVDVSPGPNLYKELDLAADASEARPNSADRYVASLDLLVAKYGAGGPATGRSQPRAIAVIPNGVPMLGATLCDESGGPRPPGRAEHSVVTVGRLAPAKHPELLPLVARALGRLMPGATLTVVGGVHLEADGSVGRNGDVAWQAMLDACGGDLPSNLFFAGPDHRSTAFLPRFAAFYMVSRDQGCPNASLEAMAAGLPVVANPDGGTAEQVEDGVTGFLVADTDDDVSYAEALALALSKILADAALARRMGAAGQEKAAREFSMAAMADRYQAALFDHPHIPSTRS